MTEEKKEKEPLITTIILTYRRPKLLKRAILSVLNQTYPNFQVCIYDNASGDKTAEIVKELSQKDPRVRYYCHSDNIGALNNLNFAFKQINTPYFSILSDDDILLPNFYEEAIKGFKKYPEAMFCATQTIIITDKKVLNISFENYEEKLYQPQEGLLKMSKCELMSWTGILFRKELIKEVGVIDAKVVGPLDYDFLLRIASFFPYVILKSIGAIFFIHKLSWSSTGSVVKLLDGFIIMLEKIKNSEEIPVSIREIVFQNVRKYTIHTLWFGGFTDIIKRNFSQAKQLAKSLKNDFDEDLKSVILYYSARLCEFSSIFYHSFIGLNQIRKFMNIKRRAKEKELQNVYGAYLKYLDKYSE